MHGSYITKATFLLAIGGVALAASAAPLITLEEAARPPSEDAAPRGISRGPGIRQMAPDQNSGPVKSPMSFKVAFEPRGGSKINPGTVKVMYLKSPSVDLSDRIKAGLSDTGIELGGVEVPPGEHRLRVTVQDSEGRESNALITLKVSK